MKKYLIIVLVLWLYLLIIPFFIDAGPGDLYTSLKGSKVYPIFVISLLVVPSLIYLVTCNVKGAYEDSLTDKFVQVNRKILKMYWIGILLLIVLFGVFIVIAAIFQGIVKNLIFCYQNFKTDNHN